MSEHLKIARILPTERNAERMLDLTAEDLERADVDPSRIVRIADSTHPELRKNQQQRLFRHRSRYLGAFAGHQLFDGTLEGYVKFGEWGAADQADFEEGEEQERLNAAVREGRRLLPEHPMGIFALQAASKDNQFAPEVVAGALLDEVVQRYTGRQIRVGLHETDPLLPVFESRHFRPTGAMGAPLGDEIDYNIQLHIR